MSFEAYIENIYTKTGKTPLELKQAAEKAGVYSPDMKAGDLVKFLKDEFDLGHGHSMAIWLFFKNEGWVDSGQSNK